MLAKLHKKTENQEKKNIFIYKYFLFVISFLKFFLDSVDYIANAVLCCPRWTNQRRNKTNKVGYLLFPLDDSLLVLADFGCLELKRVAEVVVDFTAYLCAC